MMLDYILAFPEVWDQSLMACLMRRESPASYLNVRSGCDRKGITTGELNASSIIAALHGPATRGLGESKAHLGALAAGGGADEPDSGRFSFAVLGNDVVVAAPYPFVFHATVAVHVLTDKVKAPPRPPHTSSFSYPPPRVFAHPALTHRSCAPRCVLSR
jgi:hypothetical protein